MDHTVVSLAERWDLFETQDRICSEAWPEFMLHDPVAGEYWMRYIEGRKDCQRLLLQGDEILGIVNTMPIRLDEGLNSLTDEGWDWALRKSVEDHEAGRTPNALFGVQVVINPKHQGKGLSSVAVGVMRTIAADLGLTQIVIPVRPDGKARFPLVPMDTYVAWKGGGLPADNWLRVHVRAGGQILRTCPRAMEIRGTVAEWEKWTGQQFPLDGDHLVPGALVPVRFDLAADQGVYVEPNVWVVHSVG